MKRSIMLLALLFSTLALSGCASTSKKSCDLATPPSAPAASSAVVSVQPVTMPVAEPAAKEIPVATRKYVSK